MSAKGPKADNRQSSKNPGLHRQVSWLLALENAVDVAGCAPIHINPIRPIGDQAAGRHFGPGPRHPLSVRFHRGVVGPVKSPLVTLVDSMLPTFCFRAMFEVQAFRTVSRNPVK